MSVNQYRYQECLLDLVNASVPAIKVRDEIVKLEVFLGMTPYESLKRERAEIRLKACQDYLKSVEKEGT